MLLPGPVVTITDPTRPDQPAEVLGGSERVRANGLRPLERVLAGLLAGCLLAAVLGGAQLRTELRRTAALDGVAVTATVLGGGSVQARSVLLVLQLSAQGGPVRLLRTAAPDGWRAVGTSPTVLSPAPALLALAHPVDCTTPLRVPATLTLDVEVTGAGSRRLQLPVGLGDSAAPVDTGRTCGDLDADEAVVLRSSSVIGPGPGVTLVLRLANTSLTPVVVESLEIPGFRLTVPAPTTLPGRSPGLLAVGALQIVELQLIVTVGDCRAARAHVAAAGRSETPDNTSLVVTGRGGRSAATLDLTGLQAFLDTELRESCPTP